MKILTPRNNKDYYDYLTGIYGIDEKVVFDRRRFTIISRLDLPIFSYLPLENDTPKKEIPVWMRKDKRVPEYVGTKIGFILEVGLKWYVFEVERYLDKAFKVCLDWTLVKTKEIHREHRLCKSPLSFFMYHKNSRYSIDWKSYDYYDDARINIREGTLIDNPILSGTPIPSFIPAEEIYSLLCSYISSMNDIEVIDSRTDTQKAESVGFDRKTSFRNIK